MAGSGRLSQTRPPKSERPTTSIGYVTPWGRMRPITSAPPASPSARGGDAGRPGPVWGTSPAVASVSEREPGRTARDCAAARATSAPDVGSTLASLRRSGSAVGPGGSTRAVTGPELPPRGFPKARGPWGRPCPGGAGTHMGSGDPSPDPKAGGEGRGEEPGQGVGLGWGILGQDGDAGKVPWVGAGRNGARRRRSGRGDTGAGRGRWAGRGDGMG